MKRAFSVFVLLLFVPLSLLAQADRGSIAGTVTDPTGAIVPKVSIAIKNENTGLSFSTLSSASGTFLLPNLPVGTYTLDGQATGFKRQTVNGIKVEVNQQSRVDIALQVGEVSSTVEVQAEVSQIQTESTDVGTVIDNKRFLDLPLTLGGGIRDPSAFIFLTPGVGGNT